MGYADPNQTGTGLRQRLYSRAFIVGDIHVPEQRFVYLVLDTQSGDTAVRHGILETLEGLGPEYAMYGQHNIAVTGTHSHSGPGAWLNYLLPQITSKGFDMQSYEAIVTGAVLSIVRAHESLSPGHLSIGSRKVLNANINRSIWAYIANPEAERQKYQDDVDKDLTLLRFTRSSDGKDIGILTWFAVHGTSMFGNNTLITGDNKGVAAYLFEKSVQIEEHAASDFVAGFSQSNVGDTSPNVQGAYCEYGEDAGKECRLEDSTCGGRNEPCHARGPFWGLHDSGTKSCYEIGRLQFDGAKAIYDAMVSQTRTGQSRFGVSSKQNIPIRGRSVRSYHTFVDLSNFEFAHPNGSIVSTCPAALGYSFAAGTTDGPGKFDFKQNNSGNPDASPVWKVVQKFIHTPSDRQRACQGLKPVLLDVGETKKPYDWSPNIVDIQLFRVGQIIIIVSPGEATTMAGRRWKEAIRDAALQKHILDSPRPLSTKTRKAQPQSAQEPIVLLGGPANTYTHYITTEEEYAIQRYEGASTLYGPHTLNAYINLTLSSLPYMGSWPQHAPPPRPAILPPINTNRSLALNRPVVVDRAGLFRSFGDVLDDVRASYRGGDVARAVFVGANPRNNLRLERTFAAVERWRGGVEEMVQGDEELKPRGGEGGGWEVVRDDADWDLVYEWKRVSTVLGTSEVTISWEIPEQVEKGMYRFRYFGDAKSLGGNISAFEGTSGVFEIG